MNFAEWAKQADGAELSVLYDLIQKPMNDHWVSSMDEYNAIIGILVQQIDSRKSFLVDAE